MNDGEPFGWTFWLTTGWLAFVILASILYRVRAGKPIFPKIPADTLFVEKKASGPWVSNGLIVAVTPDQLVVVPRFPGTLMFLPEIYRFERTIPRKAIRRATRTRSLLGINVVVDYGDLGQKLRLKLRDPDAFIAALERRR